MSRGDGFETMDVAVGIVDDVKFKKLARDYPNVALIAFAGYMGILGNSWREGQRLTAEEGWPALTPFHEGAVEGLRKVGLLDSKTRINARSWSTYFVVASNRREIARERYARANKARAARSTEEVTASEHRGNSDATQAIRSSPLRSSPTDIRSGGGKPRPVARTRTRGRGTPPMVEGTRPLRATTATDSEERR